MITCDAPAHVLTYPISVDYVSGWSLERALAEAVSNAIDADPDGFTAFYDESAKELVIEDFAQDGVGVEGMVFGYSDKTGRDDVIGQFGEGLKIATIRAVSDDRVRGMRVETVGYAFIPRVSDHMTSVGGLNIPRRSGSVPQVLTWELYPSGRERGTRVTIGCPKAVADAVLDRFRHLRVAGYTPPQKRGEVIPDEPGKVYVGGVFINDYPSLTFGYDLPLSIAKRAQNRDRTLLENYLLQDQILSALSATDDLTVMTRYLYAAQAGLLPSMETRLFTSINGQVPSRIRSLWQDAGRVVFGDLTTLFYRASSAQGRDDEDALALRDRGFDELTVDGITRRELDALAKMLGVRKAREARAQDTTETEWSRDLTSDEQAFLASEIELFRKAFGTEVIGTVRLFDQTRNGADCHLSWFGFYHPSRPAEVAIRRSLVSDPSQFRETLLHECAHRCAHQSLCGINVSDYADRTRGFETALTSMGARLIDYFASGVSAATVGEPKPSGPKIPTWVASLPVLPAGFRYVFPDNPRQYPGIELDSSAEAQAYLEALLSRWTAQHNVPHRSRYAAFGREHQINAQVVRKILAGSPGRGVTFDQVRSLVEPLGGHAGAVWWAMIGGQQVWRRPHLRGARCHVFRAPEREQAKAALAALVESGEPWVSLSVPLEQMTDDGWGEDLDREDGSWVEPLRDLVTAAAREAALAEDMGAGVAWKVGSRDVVNAWETRFLAGE